MSHPHPGSGPRGPIGHVPPPPPDIEEEPRSSQRRLLVAGVLLAVIAVLACVLTWQAVTSKNDARSNAAAADRACRQVQGLGQKCATQSAEEGVAAAAVVPAGTPSIAGSLRPSGMTRAATPEESAQAQAGQPGGPVVNPGSDLIVGLTLREGRLEVSYADGTVVDAGRVEGAPPAIVLLVGPSVSPSPSPSPVGEASLEPGPETTGAGSDPDGGGAQPSPSEETYVP